MLTQGLKQLEREKNYDIFVKKTGEMVIAEVVAVSDDFVTLDVGYDTETSIPAKDLAPQTLQVGDQIRVYITKVELTPKGPKVFVSRTDRNLVKRLMENAIPELHEGVIEIVGIARDPGDRSKICVASHNPKVDPVGACLGRNGTPHQGRHRGARRREDRHLQVFRGSRRTDQERDSAGEGLAMSSSTSRRRARSPSSPTTSSRSQSGKRARTRALPSNHRVGRSTSSRRPTRSFKVF
ncbi:MAG: S1 RNA-binding domain-containing protein [Bacillus subtilis]|nr:S1 RNA-binding domain-containing protein [Bacillus subtilis]